MNEKDITEKILADHNDVFADIVNVLLFNGEQVISPDDLENTKTVSQYKAGGKIHELERDVSKLLKKEKVIISLIGFEHQTEPYRFMPVRVIGYDGQAYREQLLDKNTARIYPVITLILYFGMKHWNFSRNLTEVLDMPDSLKPFVSDYEMKNIFEIAFLSPEQVKMFRSDFRYVADYFVQKRMTNDYRPNPDTIRHVDDVLKIMSVLTGDRRFENSIPDFKDDEGDVSMEEILDRAINKGYEKGRRDGLEQGIEQGREEGRLSGRIEIYYRELKHSPEQIAAETGQPVDIVLKIISTL